MERTSISSLSGERHRCIDECVTKDYEGVEIPKEECATLTDASNEDEMQVAKKNNVAVSETKKVIRNLTKVAGKHAKRLVIYADVPCEAWN